MRRFIALLLLAVMCLSFVACGGKDKDVEQESNDEKANKYSNIIDLLEKGDYSSAINEIERIQEEERLAELANKGIVEIEITLDNWNQYFEYTPKAEVNITNAFGEPTSYNFAGGIKLKDAYTMVQKGGTSVKFEFESAQETRSCTVNFDTGDVIIGGVVAQNQTILDTFTTRYHDNVSLYIGLNGSTNQAIAGYGWIQQIGNGYGTCVTQNIDFYTIANMLRVEGKLVIYQNS